MNPTAITQTHSDGNVRWGSEPFLPAEDWMKDAACLEVDPDLFFPEKGVHARRAKKVCASCDVVAQCARFALAGEERWGVWGGESEWDRRLKNRRQK